MNLLKKIITHCTLITLLIFSYDCTAKLQEDRSGIEWGLSARQGHRKTMEDRHSVETLNSLYFVGVYDGHGGDKAAEYVKKHLYENFLGEKDKTIEKRLTNAFLKTDKNFLNNSKLKNDPSGTTAVVAVVDPKKKSVVIANTGDSRAIVVRDGKVLLGTKDHKPGTKLERKRIEDAGGFVAKYHGRGCLRVCGRLAVSRAIGDRDLKKWVIPDPDIYEESYKEGDILVLACDGVWDVMTNEEVATFVHKKFTGGLTQNIIRFLLGIITGTCGEEAEEGGDERIKLIARTLRNTAYQKGSRDNISVLIVKFTPTKSRKIALPQVALQNG